eukprot:TRINITY_DN74768_c0_g1_i1.p1 TRINITY_DN74768_c0_g1~~TRINITY_DN74768_c0_g1_i1.p1  ORF type:complete len:734 (-),score=91.41 TRINITY_DN74768_c0_g1_i1:135-2336(-)
MDRAMSDCQLDLEIHNAAGDLLAIDLAGGSTVADLKQSISEHWHVPSCVQTLVVGTLVLCDASACLTQYCQPGSSSLALSMIITLPVRPKRPTPAMALFALKHGLQDADDFRALIRSWEAAPAEQREAMAEQERENHRKYTADLNAYRDAISQGFKSDWRSRQVALPPDPEDIEGIGGLFEREAWCDPESSGAEDEASSGEDGDYEDDIYDIEYHGWDGRFVCPCCSSLLAVVGHVPAPFLHLTAPTLRRTKGSLRHVMHHLHVVSPDRLSLRRIDGASVRRLKLELGDGGSIASFVGISVLFPHVEEFYYTGGDGEPGAQADLRGIAQWHASLRVLELRLCSGIECMPIHGPRLLAPLVHLEELRLEYFRSTTSKDIDALCELPALKRLIFWGEFDADDAECTLDLSACKSLQLVAFRSLSFCLQQERRITKAIALKLPIALKELVVVNDMGPLAGMTPKLRQTLAAEHTAALFVEYAPYDGSRWPWRLSSSEETSIRTKSDNTFLWDVPGRFKSWSANEMDAFRKAEIVERVRRVEDQTREMLDRFRVIGVSPSTDGPFQAGDGVWILDDMYATKPVRRQAVVQRAPATVCSDSDDDLAFEKRASMTYIVLPVMPRWQDESIAISPRHVYDRPPPVPDDTRKPLAKKRRLAPSPLRGMAQGEKTVCDCCGDRFASEQGRRDHERMKHGVERDKPPAREPSSESEVSERDRRPPVDSVCRLCGFKVVKIPDV